MIQALLLALEEDMKDAEKEVEQEMDEADFDVDEKEEENVVRYLGVIEVLSCAEITKSKLIQNGLISLLMKAEQDDSRTAVIRTIVMKLCKEIKGN